MKQVINGAEKDASSPSAPFVASSGVGLSLKNQHFPYILENRPDIDFFEIHAENFMSEGGNHMRFLEMVCEKYALSIHGVGMSLGSAEGLSKQHLKAFRRLVDLYNPALVSEHLAWSVKDGVYLNDLLPVPLTEESLRIFTDNVNAMQDAVGRQILVENPSAYMAFENDSIEETDFLNTLSQQTGCGLLLDVNNVFVSGKNMGWSPEKYLRSIEWSRVGEIHLAGHTVKSVHGRELRIDDHGSEVNEKVWGLYETVIFDQGFKPTLVEWDNDVPDFTVLENEAAKVRAVHAEVNRRHGLKATA